MFITLTFIDQAGTKFYDRTINASQIRSFKAHSYYTGSPKEGTQIDWTDTSRSPSMVTAKHDQIAEALGATNLTS